MRLRGSGFALSIVSLKPQLSIKALTWLARTSAHSVNLRKHSLEFAHRAYAFTKDAREDAEAKSETLVEIARAVLVASRPEAATFFDKSVEVVSKIGDENLDRWDALLHLADRAADQNSPNPEAAYRLARGAELTYDYVNRDKHFDWGATVRAIAGLCGSSSIAILSRWRDRNFGMIERILPIAISFLVERGDLKSELILPLIGFRVQWNEPKMLKVFFETDSSNEEKKAAAALIYRYMTLAGKSSKTWRALNTIAVKHGVLLPEIDQRIELTEREEQSRESGSGVSTRNNLPLISQEDTRNWDTIFSDVDFSVANHVASSYRRFKDSETPRYDDLFFDEACRRVMTGKEAEFISAFAEVIDFGLSQLRSLIEKLPSSWTIRLSVKPALARTLKIVCRRCCMEISKSRYYERLPLKAACDSADMVESDLIEHVLAAIGEAEEIAGAHRLFTLVGLLTPMLSQSEALAALNFGIELFDSALEDSDGDGPWSSQLLPPVDFEGALAGYIFGCLAAPKASLRWEAAHVVRALCELRHTGVLEHLIAFAKGGSVSAFHDSRLHFYKLHAHQWLLIGLARSAKENPAAVALHSEFLVDCAFDGKPHVMIREFASRALQSLIDTGALVSTLKLASNLAGVNVSAFPTVDAKSPDRYKVKPENVLDEPESCATDDKFYFGLDVESYWFESLGRCFGVSSKVISRAALREIRAYWKPLDGSKWDDDERWRRGIFRDGEGYHSHGSSPRTDDLRFYLSYHAMMIVAGDLLLTTPVYDDENDSLNEFQEWFKWRGLSRLDQKWIADRRDPCPLEWSDWQEKKETDDWRWSTTRGDFDRVLRTKEGRINLWGRWTAISGRRQESVHICSALVSSDRSNALLNALQTTSNSRDYRIPDFDDDLQIDIDGFELKGWIEEQSRDSRLDEYDPWAGAIRYPPPVPGASIIKALKLDSGSENREWVLNGKSEASAWAQVWGKFRDRDEVYSDTFEGVKNGFACRSRNRKAETPFKMGYQE
jgi:hypothetical protein